jgi:sulfate-transporting ATPase
VKSVLQSSSSSPILLVTHSPLFLSKMLKDAPNVIMLDEPTNDLDVDVLRSLEDALDRFAGSAIVISHDRYFLDRLCTHILAFEGDSNVVYFEGNYTDYEQDRKRRLGSKFDPKRIKFRKIVM